LCSKIVIKLRLSGSAGCKQQQRLDGVAATGSCIINAPYVANVVILMWLCRCHDVAPWLRFLTTWSTI